MVYWLLPQSWLSRHCRIFGISETNSDYIPWKSALLRTTRNPGIIGLRLAPPFWPSYQLNTNVVYDLYSFIRARTLVDTRHFAGLYRDFLEFSQTRAIRNAAANYRSRSTVFWNDSCAHATFLYDFRREAGSPFSLSLSRGSSSLCALATNLTAILVKLWKSFRRTIIFERETSLNQLAVITIN